MSNKYKKIKSLLKLSAIVASLVVLPTVANAEDTSSTATTIEIGGVQNSSYYKSGVANGSATTDGGTLTLTKTDGSGSDSTYWVDFNDTTINLNGGTLTVEGYEFGKPYVNGTLTAEYGNIYLTGDTLTIAEGSEISKAVYVETSSSSTLHFTGGTATLAYPDVIKGAINLESGTLTFDNLTNREGAITQVGGNLTITDTFDFNQTTDDIIGGNLNIGEGTTTTNVSVSKNAIIGEYANVTINDKATLTVENNGNVTLNHDDTIAGNITVNDGGSLALVGVTKDSSSKFIQTGGTTTVTGDTNTFDLNSEFDKVEGGSFTIGDGINNTTMNVSKGSIDSGATVDLKINSKLNVTGGNIVLDSGDTLDGDLSMSGGTTTFSGISKNTQSTYKQTGGESRFVGVGDNGTSFDLNSAFDSITGGTVRIGETTKEGTDNAGVLTISKGILDSGATVDIEKKGTLNVSGGVANLNSGDDWFGTVNVSDGTLNISGLNKGTKDTSSEPGILTQTGGTVNISSEFDLNNSSDKISAGNFNVTSTLNVTKGTIEENAIVNLGSSSVVNITDSLESDGKGGTAKGSVTLDKADTWAGAINVKGGSLALIGIKDKTGTLTQTYGTTTVTGDGFDLNSSSDKISGGTFNIGNGTDSTKMSISKGTIEETAIVNINQDSEVTVNGGTLALGENTTWDGNIYVESGTVNINDVSKDEKAIFTQSGGTTTVLGTNFAFNNDEDAVTDGTFNIGNGTEPASMKLSNGTINTKATVAINNKATLNVDGGTLELDSGDTYTGTLSVTGGEVDLNDITKDSAAILTQSGGTINATGTSLSLNNKKDTLSGGTINIGNGSDSTDLDVTAGTIEKGSILNLNEKSVLDINGGNVTLSDNDNLNGSINVKNGNLTLADIIKNPIAVLTQTGGTTTVTGTSELNNDDDSISGGKLNIGGKDSSGNAITGTLIASKGTIEKDAVVNIAQGSTLNVNGATTNLNDGDNWAGEVKLTDGNLNLSDIDVETTDKIKYNQESGTLNLDNSTLKLATSASKITDGTINVDDSSTLDISNGADDNTAELNSTGGKIKVKKSSKFTMKAGEIDKDSAITVEEGSTISITNDSTVTADGSNDDLSGNIELKDDATLTMTDKASKTTTTKGKFTQTNGNLKLTNNAKLNINDTDSQITDGNITIDNATLTLGNKKENTANITTSEGNLNLNNSSTLNVTGGEITKDTKVEVASGSTLKVTGSDAVVRLNKTDKADGNLKVEDGTLYISDDLSKVTTANGTFVQTGGLTKIDSAALTLNDENSKISGGELDLTNGASLTVANTGASITSGNVTIDDTSVLNYLAKKGLIQSTDDNGKITIDTSGLINMINDLQTNSKISSLIVNNTSGDGTANFAIDISGRTNNSKGSDTITANTIQASSADSKATINISDWNFVGGATGKNAPIDKHIRLGKIFSSNNTDENITYTATDKELDTPIGTYKLNASSANDGSYTLDLTKINPRVYRGQVATASQYFNQLVVTDTLFNRAQIRRYGVSYGEKYANKTALIEMQTTYERTLKDGGVWTEVYGNFEKLKFNRGIGKVKNNAWGIIVGADFGQKELKNGWAYLPTLFIAYNGATQDYSDVDMTENGAQIGFMNSWTKKNAIDTAMIYTGFYRTDMSIGSFDEDKTNYFFGLANKVAYDWKIGRHFKIQPALSLSYNLFGKQKWHTDYGNMDISSSLLNGFNIAPNITMMMERETWSAYLTIAYAWNIFGGLDGKVGNIDLDSLKLSQGYLQYGLGFNKNFSDRLNMYLQATVRNLGRTGIVCQGGVNWKW